MSALGLVGRGTCGSFRDFLAVFSPIALSPPPISRGSHIFPTTSAKVFISSGDDVRVGEAPLFTARASPFLSSTQPTPSSYPPPGINRSVSRSGRREGWQRGGREKGEKRGEESVLHEIYVYVLRDKSLLPRPGKCNHSPIHARCMTIITSFLSASLRLSSSSRFIFFNSRHFSSFSVKSLTTNVRRTARGGVERYRSPMEPQLLSTRSNGCLNVYRINDVSA